MGDAVRKDGLSAAIFPEGKRSHSTTLRPFKKGAFLIALRARVPIIPIVIHWKIRALDQHMADVFDQFQEVLGQ